MMKIMDNKFNLNKNNRPYGKLISIADSKQNSLAHDIIKLITNMHVDKFTFKTESCEKGLSSIDMPKLLVGASKEVLSWVKKYRALVRLLKLEEQVARDNLYFLMDEEYHVALETTTSLDAALDKVVQVEFNQNSLPKYLAKFKKLKVGRDMSLAEYNNKFYELVGKVNTCVCKKDQLTNREIEEKYQNGLPYWMQVEYVKLLSMTHGEKIKILTKLENLRKEKLLDHNGGNPPVRPNKPIKKWCPYHKTPSHNKEECFKLNKKLIPKTATPNSDLTKKRVIKEITPNVQKRSEEGRGGKGCLCQVDTR